VVSTPPVKVMLMVLSSPMDAVDDRQSLKVATRQSETRFGGARCRQACNGVRHLHGGGGANQAGKRRKSFGGRIGHVQVHRNFIVGQGLTCRPVK
jgi:hypothetical protein